MYTFEGVLVSVVVIVFSILQMMYFIHDDRTPNTDNLSKRYSDVWHATGGLLRLVTCYVIGRTYGWPLALIALVTLWIWFDGAINTWVLRKEWWYVGTTARTDRFIRWIGGKLKLDPRTVNGAVKALTAIGVLFYFIKTLI